MTLTSIQIHTQDYYKTDVKEKNERDYRAPAVLCWRAAAKVDKLPAIIWRQHTLWEFKKVKIDIFVWLIFFTVHCWLNNRYLKKQVWKGKNSNGKNTQEATLKCSSANTHYFYTRTVKEEEKILHYIRVTLQISGLKRGKKERIWMYSIYGSLFFPLKCFQNEGKVHGKGI